MSSLLEKLSDKVRDYDLGNYWEGFQPVAYALYNNEFVYLFNHPTVTEGQKYSELKWTEQFNGANTLILYEDYPTAIVNISRDEDFESSYFVLIHELFHGYQFIREEKRFPDEVLGFQYPLLAENIELRNKERMSLYDAFTNKENRKQSINEFIALRERRSNLIGDYIQYEYRMESVEGPAWYVELHAYNQVSPLSFDDIMPRYSDLLLDKKKSNANIRLSCYAPGLFMCLLLDEVSSDWQEKFITSDQNLYEFFKQYFNGELLQISDVKVSDESREILDYCRKVKEDQFEAFHKLDGYDLYIDGEIKYKGFDPMNIISLDNKLLHNSFVILQINDTEYFFQQPTMVYYEDKIHNIKRIHLKLLQEPSIKDDTLMIEGVREITGKISREGNAIYLKV